MLKSTNGTILDEDGIMIDKRSSVLAEFLKRERELGLFNIKIDGIVVYGFLCRDLRKKYLQKNGVLPEETGYVTKKKSNLKNTIISFFQLLKLSLSKKSYDNFIYSFYRVDKIGDYFLDKFTDPIIDNSTIKDSYIIFEKSHNFEHKNPRLHRSKLVYTDYIEQKAIRFANQNKSRYIEQYKKELEILWSKLDELMVGLTYSKDWTVIRLLRDKSMMDFYNSIFLNHKIKRFIAPCRAVFLPHMYVCKDLKIPVIELQHGINYGMGSITYLGYDDRHFEPDYFLSFEDLQHKERYGAENCIVVNTGWALSHYINNIVNANEKHSNQILVVSSMLVDSLFRFVEMLARKFPTIEFHIRLHPLTHLTSYAQGVIKRENNIVICDNSTNIAMELTKYDMVIGDNSTVMEEALGYGKKVGRIYYDDMIPKYYSNEEKTAEWEISDINSFKLFLESPVNDNLSFKFYSPFNSVILEEVLKQTN